MINKICDLQLPPQLSLFALTPVKYQCDSYIFNWYICTNRSDGERDKYPPPYSPSSAQTGPLGLAPLSVITNIWWPSTDYWQDLGPILLRVYEPIIQISKV